MKTYSHIITLTSFLLFSCGAGGVGESNHDVNSTEDQNSSITSSDQNGSRLVLVTTTSGVRWADAINLEVYAQIIGLDDSRFSLGLLDNINVDDRKRGQVDTYSFPFDYPVSNIRGVELVVKGRNGWKAKAVSFQFFDGGKESEAYEFEVNQWFSTEQLDIDQRGAVTSKMFSFRPELK